MIIQTYQFTGTLTDIAHMEGFRNHKDYMGIFFEEYQMGIIIAKNPYNLVSLAIISEKKDNNIIHPRALETFYDLIKSGLIVYNPALEIPDMPKNDKKENVEENN